MKHKNCTTVVITVTAMWGSIEWILPACQYLKGSVAGLKIIFLILRKDKKEIFKGNLSLAERINEITEGCCYDYFDLSPGWIRCGVEWIGRFNRWLTEKTVLRLKALFFWHIWNKIDKKCIESFVSRCRPNIALMDGFVQIPYSAFKKHDINVGYYLPAPSFSFCKDAWVDTEKSGKNRTFFGFDFFLVDTKDTSTFFQMLNPQKKVFQTGCPKYDTKWISTLKHCRPDFVKQRANSDNPLVILILLKVV